MPDPFQEDTVVMNLLQTQQTCQLTGFQSKV